MHDNAAWAIASNLILKWFPLVSLQSHYLWQVYNKEPKFHTAEPIKANLAQNLPKLSIVGLRPSNRSRTSDWVSNEKRDRDVWQSCSWLRPQNQWASQFHRRYEDALREGSLLRYQFPRDDIKVCEITEEVMEGTLLHWLRFSDSLEADAIFLKEVDCVQPNWLTQSIQSVHCCLRISQVKLWHALLPHIQQKHLRWDF